MKQIRLPLAEIELIVMTGAAVGIGLGLLIAGHLSARQRQKVGWLMLMSGGISTFPLRADVMRQAEAPRMKEIAV